jgi:hypothetical protein
MDFKQLEWGKIAVVLVAGIVVVVAGLVIYDKVVRPMMMAKVAGSELPESAK